jgi:dipeptidyl aminopeptidase/acylaminoacyl peptidase
MKPLLALAVVLGTLPAASRLTAADPPKRPMQIDDLFKFKRVADPQISPDGKLVAYQVTAVDLGENKTSTALWVAATDGTTPPRPVTSSGKRDAHPRWSPDGKKLLFESNRGGTQQLYVLDLEAGGEAVQLTNISTGAGNGVWSPDGKHVAFVSTVYPEFSELPFEEADRKNKEKDEAAEKSPVKARVFTRLFFRHWDSYVEDKRQHVFVITADGKDCRNVTPGDRDANPTSSTFSVGDDHTFTPDGKHIVFTAVPAKNEAWSTNYDLCRVRITNSSGAQSGRHPTDWETLTKDNEAADNHPRFSPDGKKLAYRAQKKAGYEADKWDILVVDVNPDGTFAGEPRNLTAAKDISIDEFLWMPDSATLLATAEESGATAVYKVAEARDGVQKFFDGGQMGSFTISRDGDRVAFQKAGLDHPPRVEVLGKGLGQENQTADPNAELLAKLDRTRPESVTVPVEGGVKMQMWILKPPGFDPAKKWPVAYLVHGGPQGAWNDGWSFRWNPQLWAAQGYVVALPNPRGSTGFGQKFVDEISGDWGGKCYRDLVAGVEYLEKLPYVDRDRLGAAGASFGGYMMNWFAVNPIAEKFKCLITHCSVWNFESMWGTTDELWFDEWEQGGPPWERPGGYREFSPHVKAGNLGKYKVPMLVIHNDLDFRCPIGQGHELFTALQRQGVPSRFINFPDEGHWVLKPQNSKYWHEEVFGWLTKHVPPGGR